LRTAGGAHTLIAEIEAGWIEGDCGQYTDTSKWNRLRTIGSVVCDAYGGVPSPSSLGLEVTLIWQLLFGGSDEGQLFFSPKSPLFVPVIWIDVMVRLIFPVF